MKLKIVAVVFAVLTLAGCRSMMEGYGQEGGAGRSCHTFICF